MSIRVTKPAFNLREKLSELDRPVGTHGSQIMKSNTISETADLVGVNRKNMVINGDFRVNQRGGSRTYGASATGYHFDMWYFHNGTNGTYIASVSSAAPSPPVQTPHYLVLDCTATDTSIGTSQYASITYAVEGYNAQQAMWGTPYAKPLTMSFYHRHTAAGVYSGVVRNASANFNYVFEYEQSSKDAWEKAVIHIKPEGTQAYNATNGKAFSFTFSMADNTYMNQTVGQWFSGTYYHASNRQTNFLNSTNNFMRFAAVQLEVGSDATPFEQRSYGEELALCKRYYQVLVDQADTSSHKSYAIACCFSGTSLHHTHLLSPEMRTTPTLDYTTGSGYYAAFQNGTSDTFDSMSLVGNSHINAVDIMVSSGLSVAQSAAALMRTQNNDSRIAFTAEL